MRIRSFSELVTPDERTLRFTPLGLSTGGTLTPEAAAGFEQAAIASADLVDAVPKSVRESFERLRTCHSYGVLWYDAFTVASDLAPIVLEQALRDRFVAFYDAAIPVETPTGQSDVVRVRDFGDVFENFRRGGRHAGWKLRPASGDPSIPVPRTLDPLMRWARREGLLHGQRNKRIEPIRARMRNWFAHGSGFRVGMPNELSREIHDLAEVINRLWGSSTPGGRLYPAPLGREIIAVGWSQQDSGYKLVRLRPDQIPAHAESGSDDWQYLMLLAVPDDENLWEFDARYELTTFPSELLWGPGSGADANRWWRTAQIEEDAVDYLDRLFVVRVDDDKVYLAQRPQIVFGLPEERRGGLWHLIQADYPLDAWGHVRHLVGESNDSADEPRCGCAIDEVAVGTWRVVRDAWARSGAKGRPIPPAPYVDVQVPRRFSYPSTVGYE